MHEIARRIFSPRGRALIFAVVLAAVTILAYRPAWQGGFLWDDDDYISQQRIINCAARLAADLVFARFPVAVFPAHLQHISHRARVVGPEHDWLSLGEPSASCWQCSSGMGGAGAVRSTRLVVGCGNFCATSSAGRVSGMDYRTQERADGLFLFADAACLDCFVDKRTRRQWIFYCLALIFYVLALSAKATACTLPAALFLILWLQKKPITMRRLMQIVPFVVLGLDGVTRSLVGTLSSRNKPRRVCLPQPDRANPRGEPGCLVLPEQDLLAFQSDIYLSEMEHFTCGFTRLHLVARGHRGVRGHLLP
jgi:hypothetical protein